MDALHNLVGAYSASLSDVDTNSSICCCCDESSTSLALFSPSNSHFVSASASSSSLRVTQPASSLLSRCDLSNG
ncbi:C6 transcription factor, partial [Fusarium oxysporum f. sp. albedinis]